MSYVSHVFMRVLNLEQSRAFYERLGLEVVMEQGKYVRLRGSNNFYIGMEERDAGEVGGPGIDLNIAVDDVDALHQKLKQDVAFEQPPQAMPWGARHAYLRDPNNYRISIFTP